MIYNQSQRPSHRLIRTEVFRYLSKFFVIFIDVLDKPCYTAQIKIVNHNKYGM